MRRVRKTLAVGVVVLMSVATAGGAAHAGGDRVEPRVWVSKVCAPARPAARDVAARIRASGDFGSRPVQGTDDAVRRVRLLDNLVGSFVQLLVELRRGAAGAGVPAVQGGERVARRVVRDLDGGIRELGVARRAFADFMAHPDSPGAVQGVVSAIEVHMSASTFVHMFVNWPPTLNYAWARTPACVEIGRILREENNSSLTGQ